MSWTDPKTWSASTFTSTDANTHIRDNLRSLGELTRAEATAAVTVSGTTDAGATTLLTTASYTYDGSTSIYLEFSCPWTSYNEVTVTLNYVVITFWDGVTDLGRAGIMGPGVGGAGGVINGGVIRSRKYTPGAGAHTFTARAWKVTGSNPGTMAVQGGAGGAGNYDKMTLRAIGAGS